MDSLSYEIDHVVTFEISEDKKEITIYENCDYYYAQTITKDQFKRVIEKLNNLYDKMI